MQAGIGLTIVDSDVGIKVSKVTDGGPAAELGVRNGDILHAINHHRLGGRCVEDVVPMIVGPLATTVHVVVNRGGSIIEIGDVERGSLVSLLRLTSNLRQLASLIKSASCKSSTTQSRLEHTIKDSLRYNDYVLKQCGELVTRAEGAEYSVLSAAAKLDKTEAKALAEKHRADEAEHRVKISLARANDAEQALLQAMSRSDMMETRLDECETMLINREKEYRDQISEADSRSASLEGEMLVLKSQLHSMEAQLKLLERKMRKLQVSKEKLQMEIIEAENVRDTAKAHAAMCLTQMNAVKSLLVLGEKIDDNLRESAHKSQVDLTGSSVMAQAVQAELAACKDRLEQTLVSLSSSKEVNAALQSKVNVLQNNLGNALHQHAAAQQNLDEQKRKTEEITIQRDAFQQKIRQLEENIQSLELEIISTRNAATRDMENQSRAIEKELQEKLQTSIIEHQRCLATVAVLQGNNASLREELSSVNSKLMMMASVHNTVTQRIQELEIVESQMAGLKDDLNRVQNERDMSIQQHALAQQENTRLHTKISQLEEIVEAQYEIVKEMDDSKTTEQILNQSLSLQNENMHKMKAALSEERQMTNILSLNIFAECENASLLLQRLQSKLSQWDIRDNRLTTQVAIQQQEINQLQHDLYEQRQLSTQQTMHLSQRAQEAERRESQLLQQLHDQTSPAVISSLQMQIQEAIDEKNVLKKKYALTETQVDTTTQMLHEALEEIRVLKESSVLSIESSPDKSKIALESALNDKDTALSQARGQLAMYTAFNHLSSQQYSQAEKLFSSAIGLQVGLDAYDGRAQARIGLKKYKEALEDCSVVAASSSENTAIGLRAAYCLLMMEEYEKSMDHVVAAGDFALGELGKQLAEQVIVIANNFIAEQPLTDDNIRMKSSLFRLFAWGLSRIAKHEAAAAVLTIFMNVLPSHHVLYSNVSLELERSQRLSIISLDDRNLLHVISRVGIASVLHLALSRGFDPNLCDKHGDTPLHAAVLRGDLTMIELLLKHKANPNMQNFSQTTALQISVRQGHIDVVKLLIANGADLNTPNAVGGTVLHEAIDKNDQMLVQMLIAHKANVDAKDSFGVLPLLAATSIGNTAIMKHILDAVSDVSVQNNEGLTALHLAMEKDTHVCRLLLLHRANPNVQDADGLTPLHIGARKNCLDNVQSLLELSHCDVNVTDVYGDTPLHEAAVKNDPNFAQCLLQHKAQPNALNEQGDTPLHVACQRGSSLVVELLLQHGANPNIENHLGDRAIHEARTAEIAEMLICFGADIATENKFGKSPLKKAMDKGHVQAAARLRKALNL